MCFNSDSQTASTTDSSIGSHNVDASVNSQNGAAISSSGTGNTINLTDGGAFSFAGSAFKDLIGAQSNSLAGILSGVQSTQNFIASTQAQASGQMDNKTKLYIGLAALGVVGLLIWSNRK